MAADYYYRNVYAEFPTSYPAAPSFALGPIDRLRVQRKPTTKPQKPRPVTDEQLLAVVEELERKLKALSSTVEIYDNNLTARIDGQEKRLKRFWEHGPLGRLFSIAWWAE